MSLGGIRIGVRRMRVWISVGVVLACCLAWAPQATALPPQGGLTQLTAPNNCIQPFAGTCGVTTGVGMTLIRDVAVSPDGKHAYATAFSSQAVAEFGINSAGGLQQLADPNECISDDPDGAGATPPHDVACQSGTGLNPANGIAISPDGLSVYVAAGSPDNAISVFLRNPTTGVLSQLADPFECVSEDPDAGGVTPPNDPGCASAIGLGSATDVAVSPDGANVYVASFGQTVAAFARDSTVAGAPLGSLTQLPGADACITQTGFGTSCTVNGGTGTGHGITSPTGIDVSDDGKNVYVGDTNGDSIAAFTRNGDGSLDQLADPNDCFSNDPDGPGGANPTDATCAGAFGLNGAQGVDVAPDGDAVYLAASFSDAVAEFQRNPATGALAPLANPNDCLSFDNDFTGPGPGGTNGANPPTEAQCVSASGLDGVNAVAVAPDNKSVYAAGTSGIVSNLAVFSRNQSSEQLDQLNEPADCLGINAANCAAATGVTGVRALSLTPSGAFLYTAAQGDSAVAAFARELPPTCASASQSVLHDTATAISLGCTDANGDPLDRSILVQPAHGSLSGDPDTGSVTYTPAAGYVGPDSFVFNAQDTPAPGQPSNVATISLNVLDVPEAVVDLPPDTSVTGKAKVRTRKKRALVRWFLGTTEPGSSFECSLDGRPFGPCASPFTARVRRGAHTLTVRSRDAAGNLDASPASFTTRVKRIG